LVELLTPLWSQRPTAGVIDPFCARSAPQAHTLMEPAPHCRCDRPILCPQRPTIYPFCPREPPFPPTCSHIASASLHPAYLSASRASSAQSPYLSFPHIRRCFTAYPPHLGLSHHQPPASASLA